MRLGLAFLLFTTLVLVDARRRSQQDAEQNRDLRSLARATGQADLAFSSGSRWLRHPSSAEPAAAFHDLPGALDLDPAGTVLGPSIPENPSRPLLFRGWLR